MNFPTKYSCAALKYRFALLAILGVLVISTLSGLENLKQNFHLRYWLSSADPHIKNLDYFENNFENDESVIIGLYNPKSVLNLDVLRKIHQFSQEILKIEDVKSTLSISNLKYPAYDSIKRNLEFKKIADLKDFNAIQILKNLKSISLFENLYVSKDKKMGLIHVKLNPTILSRGEVLKNINYQNLTHKLRVLQRKYHSENFQIFINGAPILQNDFNEVSQKDMAFLLPILFLIIFIIFYYLFRSVLISIVAVTVISVTNTVTFSIAGLLNIEIENMVGTVPLIVLTIAMADIIHFFISYRTARVKNLDHRDSIKKAIEENFYPTLLTSLTTSLGFIALFNSKLIPVKNMGILAAIGIMLAWFLTISLFPIVLSFIKTKFKYEERPLININFKTFIHFLVNRKTIILTVTCITVILFAFIGTKNKVSTDPIKFFKKDHPNHVSADFILSHFGAVSGPEIVIHSGYREGILEVDFLEKVERFTNWLKSKEYISKTISIIELGKELNQKINNDNKNFYKIPDTKEEIIDLFFEHKDELTEGFELNSYISNDLESMRVSLLWSLTDTEKSLIRLEEIHTKARSLGLNIDITGKSTLYLEMNDYVVDTFFQSIFLAVIALSLLMLYLFKSIKFALLSMIPNLVPLCFITGIMTLTGIYIDIGTALVCSVCIGIAIDDTIHFLYKYKSIRKELSEIESIDYVFKTTGVALILTSSSLIIGFGLFLFSEFVPNIKFGFLCSLTILIALVCDFLILPALMLNKKSS